MRVVVDTNVWVSAFLTPGGTPGRLLEEVKRGWLILVYSLDIEAEYREVLARAKFSLDPLFLAEFFARLEGEGQRVRSGIIASADLPDPDDAPFIATALAVGCPIVTGNARHFPDDCGVEILTTAACLARVIG